MRALSEPAYTTLHQLLNELVARAYERGYKDAKDNKPAHPTKVSMANVRRIKLS